MQYLHILLEQLLGGSTMGPVLPSTSSQIIYNGFTKFNLLCPMVRLIFSTWVHFRNRIFYVYTSTYNKQCYADGRHTVRDGWCFKEMSFSMPCAGCAIMKWTVSLKVIAHFGEIPIACLHFCSDRTARRKFVQFKLTIKNARDALQNCCIDNGNGNSWIVFFTAILGLCDITITGTENRSWLWQPFPWMERLIGTVNMVFTSRFSCVKTVKMQFERAKPRRAE